MIVKDVQFLGGNTKQMSENVKVAEPTWISKMTVKGLGCVPAGVGAGEKKRLCVIYGKADGIKTGEDKRDGRIWSCLTGSFAGFNLTTKEQFRSGKLFLPGGIHEVIENAVRKVNDGEGSGGLSVKFGLEIMTVKAENPIGYTYQAVSVVPTEETDELSELEKAIEAGRPNLLALSVPAPAPAPTVAATMPAATAKKGK